AGEDGASRQSVRRMHQEGSVMACCAASSGASRTSIVHQARRA
ncbi:hypothetical protein A2U01_0119006, partial [Trifolium medium]|nr:hypothetical protein [Trifolium medium]